MPVMSDSHPASPTAHDPAGSAAPADSDHGHAGHGQASEALGPIDIVMWGVGLLGVTLGLLVALCTAFAVGVL